MSGAAHGATGQEADSILWVHGDCLNAYGPALRAHAGAPALWVWDEALLRESRISLKRVVFIYECLLELPVVIRRGDVAEALVAFAREHGAARVATTASPSPRFEAICNAVEAAGLEIVVYPEAPFAAVDRVPDLNRFSRYWRVAQRKAMLKTGEQQRMETITVRVWDGDEEHVLQVAPGTNLREALLAHDLSPYATFTRYTNCGGRGLCATCGVHLGEETLPVHWHDRLAQRFGYPRLSCQITVEEDMTVFLDNDKWVWGGRRRDAAEPPDTT